MEITNRTVLITGGSTGIGFALAEAFIEKSNQVIICGRSEEKLLRAKLQLPSVETIRCDITNNNDLNNLVSVLSSKFPELNTLINNAGMQTKLDFTISPGSSEVISLEIATNLTAQVDITHRLYPLLSANRSPAIVFIGSALGLVPKYEAPVYSATKAGIHSLVQSLRQQSTKEGVAVFEVFPEVVNTPMAEHRANEMMMAPESLAKQVLSQLEGGTQDIYIGRTRALSILHRIMPGMARALVNKPQINRCKRSPEGSR